MTNGRQNNFMRCTLGAVGVGVVEKMQQTWKERVVFTSLAGFTLLSTVLLWVEWIYGPRWRRQRTARLERD